MPFARFFLLLTVANVAWLGANAAHAQWPSLGLFGGGAQPGTPDWWEEHENNAVLEPGKGYRVPGFEGYFDGEGRPMNAPTDEVVAAMRARENRPTGILPNLDPKRGIQAVKTAVNGGPNQQAAAQLLEEGRTLFAEKKYSRAASAFKAAAARLPGSNVEEEALFYIAESYFRDDRYVAARDGYDRLVSKYPSTRRLDTLVERQWKIAEYWEKYHEYNATPTMQPNFFDKTRPTFDTIGQAIKTYDSIRLNDPTGPRADDAIMRTAGIYFAQARYDDADYHYTLLREDYPRSEWQFEAHLLGLQSKLRMYQGTDYDSTPLEDAKKLSKRISTNFSGRLSPEEKERLRTVDAQIRRSAEERDLRTAQYYENIQQYGAARIILAQLAREHAGSPVADQAATRLAELGGLPAEPEKPMARFVELFPENREQAKFAQIPEVKAAREATRLANNPQRREQSGVVPASATETAPTVQR